MNLIVVQFGDNYLDYKIFRRDYLIFFHTLYIYLIISIFVF